MKIQILELIEGAKKASGLTVIIDVFRAFSLECYLFAAGAERIYPIGSMEEAFSFHAKHPDYVLIGERGGARVEGCDFGNSPSQTAGFDFHGKRVIHSTSAGTQGIVNASSASEIITASLVNAKAVARYILEKDPETVSIVAMGNSGVRTAPEDVLCAEYIRSLLIKGITDMKDIKEIEETKGIKEIKKIKEIEGTASFKDSMDTKEALKAQDDSWIQSRADDLRYNGGEHFFDPDRQSIFPREDFELCTRCNRFDFVIHVGTDADGRLMTYPG